MIDFDWELEDIAEDIGSITSHIKTTLLRPHDAVWPNSFERFEELAAAILENISEGQRNVFFSCCLASYLLTPQKAPIGFESWFQKQKNLSIKDILGVEISFQDLRAFKWGRVAIALAVPKSNKGCESACNNDPPIGKIVYAMAGVSKGKVFLPLIPEWATDYFDGTARHAALNAASLVSRTFQDNTKCFLWPMTNSSSVKRQIEGASLGLPVMLAFMSLAHGRKVAANILATGELDTEGQLHKVEYLEQKLEEANVRGFTTFLYPLFDDVKEPQAPENAVAERKGAVSRQHAEEIWFSLDKDNTRNKLAGVLKPISFDYEINSLITGFTGRDWLKEKIDAWVSDSDGSRFFWLSGGPGLGKSSFAAWICANRYYISAKHFCNASNLEKNNPKKMITSLACQLAFQLPQYQERLERLPVEQYLLEYKDSGYTLFNKLILEPMAKDFTPPETCCIILIDALDEATSDGANDIAFVLDQISNILPSWLRFLITSRPEQSITKYANYLPHEIDYNSKENTNDIIEYLKNRLPGITQQQLNIIVERSDGSFLYVHHICNDIRDGYQSLECCDALPKGMNRFYQNTFKRMGVSQFESVYPLLKMIAAAYEPLSPDLLKQLTGINEDREFKKRLKLLGSLIKAPSNSGTTQGVVVPHHYSLFEWLTEEKTADDYYVSKEDGLVQLADYGLNQCQQLREQISPYFLAWLPKHLVECGRENDAVQFLRDFDMIMARVKAGLLDQMLSDYRSIEPHLLEDEAVFFKDNAHILRKADSFWSADKILLQLAAEHQDGSPITKAAEAYIMAGKVNWLWLKRNDRAVAPDTGSLLQSFAGHTDTILGAIHLDSSRVLSWSKDNTVRVWSRETGKELHSSAIDNIRQVHKLNYHLCICLAPQCAVILDFIVLTEHIASATLQLSDDSVVVCDHEYLYFVKNAYTERIALEQGETARCIIECSIELILIIGIQGSIIAFNPSSKRLISKFMCIYDICNVRQLDKDQVLLNCTDRKIIWNYTINQTIEITGTPLPGKNDIDKLITNWLLLSGSSDCKYLINLNNMAIEFIYSNWKLNDDRSIVIFVDNDKLRVLHTDSFNEVITYRRSDYESRVLETIQTTYLINTSNNTFIALPEIWNISHDNRYLAFANDTELIVYETSSMEKVFNLNKSGIKSVNFCKDYLVVNKLYEEVSIYALFDWSYYLCFNLPYDESSVCEWDDTGHEFDDDDTRYYLEELHYDSQNITHYYHINRIECCNNTLYFKSEKVWLKYNLEEIIDDKLNNGNYIDVSLTENKIDEDSVSVDLNRTAKRALADVFKHINCSSDSSKINATHSDVKQNYCLYKRIHYTAKKYNILLNNNNLNIKAKINRETKTGYSNHEYYLSNIGCICCEFTQSADNLLRLRTNIANEPILPKHVKSKIVKLKYFTELSGAQAFEVLRSESFYITTSINGLITVFNKATLQVEKTFIFRKTLNKDISKGARENRYSRTILGASVLFGDRLAVWNDEIVRIYDLINNVYNSGTFCERTIDTVCFTVTVKFDDFSEQDYFEDYKLKQYKYYVHITEGSITHGCEGKYVYFYDSGGFRDTSGKHERNFILDKQIDYIIVDNIELMEVKGEFIDDNNLNDEYMDDEYMDDEVLERNITVTEIKNAVEIRINKELGRWYAHTDTLLFDKTRLIDISPSGRLVLKVPSGKSFYDYDSGYIKPVFSVLVLDIMKGADQCLLQENECANMIVNIPTPEEIMRNQLNRNFDKAQEEAGKYKGKF